MTGYVFAMLIAAGVTFLATPVVRRVAERRGAMTLLRERDVHTVPTPRLGGLAMLAGVAVAFVVSSQLPFLQPVFQTPQSPWGVLGACAIVAAIGAIDDLWGMDWWAKLAGQVLASGFLAWQGVQILSLPVGSGVAVGSGGMFLILTIGTVVVTINAVNFIDGLDGLAAGVMAVAGTAFFVYAYLLNRQVSPFDYSSLAALIIVTMVGCCLGFLPHNVHPARIFMGDSGAMQLGLLIAASAIAITGQVDPTVVSSGQFVPAFLPMLVPVAVLMLPLADLGLAVVRRLGRGQSPFAPDRLHLHHRLLDLGHSHARAVGLMCLWTAVLAFGAILTAFVPWQIFVPAWLLAVAISIALTVLPGRRRVAQ